MAAHRHMQHGQLASGASGPAPALAGRDAATWLLAAPLAFYAAWQAAYFLLVQVLVRRHIIGRRLDTSYRCLTRRAARADNVWARLVLRGGTARRLAAYGLLQLAFTGEPRLRAAASLLGSHGTWHCTGQESLQVAESRQADCTHVATALHPSVQPCSVHPAAVSAHLLQPSHSVPLANCQVYGAR